MAKRNRVQVKDSQGFEPKPKSKVEDSNQMEIEFDEDANTATFSLTTGHQLTLSEPKPKQFLLLESWLQNADEEYRSNSFVVMKLAQLCLVDMKVTFNQFLDMLDNFDDIERVAAAIGFFRNSLEDFFSRMPKQSDGQSDDPS
ncbi:MAG: hypothetical protein ACFE0I_02555 [Elainellaceae cyanobacterium]